MHVGLNEQIGATVHRFGCTPLFLIRFFYVFKKILLILLYILWLNLIEYTFDTMEITVQYVPVSIMGMVFMGTGMD